MSKNHFLLVTLKSQHMTCFFQYFSVSYHITIFATQVNTTSNVSKDGVLSGLHFSRIRSEYKDLWTGKESGK